MSGLLKQKKYLHVSKKKFDPISIAISLVGIVIVFITVAGISTPSGFFDWRGIIIVMGGTFASVLFQFDLATIVYTSKLLLISLKGTPEKQLLSVLEELDQTIINDGLITELRNGEEINGELLNDIVYMHQNGLLYEEIDEFVTAKIKDEFLSRQMCVLMLQKAANITPALGLFGTVIGLIGVLKSLSKPSEIGPSMSLALMTTAYGSALSYLVLAPLAGRIDHHNTIYLEVHRQLLSKVAILLNRENRRFDTANIEPRVA